jgi:S-adenosylmethionine/arginine decarboxylase-like enzyme
MRSFQEYREAVEHIKPEKAEMVGDRPLKADPKEEHWGYHLIMDMSHCNKDIDKPEVIKKFLKQMVKDLDMTAVGEPIIKHFDTPPYGRGTTGVQILTTSTITFHSDDEKWSLYLDVFSCKSYDPKVVFDAVKKYFAPKHIGHKWLYRDAGDWPRKKKSK